MIKEVTNKLLNLEEVSTSEIREVFEEIFSGLSNEIQTTSFLTALNKLEQNNDYITCAIESSITSIKKPYSILNIENVIENITINNKNNLFDISLIQDLICSSAELNISKYSFASNLENNSFDILKKMGVNLKKEIDYANIEFEKLNFNYFYLSEELPYFKYSESIRLSLPFDNIFNITKKMLNPLGAKNLFLGVNKKSLVDKFANISLKLQKNNSIVVCGNDSLPFISPNGESYIAEAWKNKIFTYEISPNLLDANDYDISEIVCENNEQNANDILDVIYNKNKHAKYEASIINSALSLYISKKADSIIDGINLAKKLIGEGLVAQKFEQIKKFYS